MSLKILFSPSESKISLNTNDKFDGKNLIFSELFNKRVEILKRYEKLFDIKYVKSDEKGLSLNRNKGLILRNGEIVGFPDDDCEYDDDTLEKVVSFFERKKNYKIYSCRTLERGKNYGTQS